MLNKNWLSVGCECVNIFSLYVSKLALNMFSLWQIYYSKYTFYMQIEACDLQIFVAFRGASPPQTPQSGLCPEPDQEATAPWTPCSYLVSPIVGISEFSLSSQLRLHPCMDLNEIWQAMTMTMTMTMTKLYSHKLHKLQCRENIRHIKTNIHIIGTCVRKQNTI